MGVAEGSTGGIAWMNEVTSDVRPSYREFYWIMLDGWLRGHKDCDVK